MIKINFNSFRLGLILTLGLLSVSCSNEVLNNTVSTYDNNVIINNLNKSEFVENQSFLPVNNGTQESKLYPDGESVFEWRFKLTDKSGNVLKNTDVKFSVEAISPLVGWRDVEEVAKRYGSSGAKLKTKVANGSIRLIGKLSGSVVKTDSEGIAKVLYTTSHIGGNEDQKATEKIVAKFVVDGNNETIENIIKTGYDDLIPVPTVDGALRIGDATGRYLQKDIVDLLLNIAQKIKSEKWEQPLTITAATLKWGGLYPPHFTHRRGGTFDFRPMSTDGLPTFCNTDGKFAANYDRKRTLDLIKILKNSGATEIIFNDPEGFKYGAKALSGHHNHLHVSWLESESRIVNINKSIF